jgi:(S)-citramalyl-CoA lyase
MERGSGAMSDDRLVAVRTLLFTPGNRPDRFAKAEATGADGQIIDLEDAVSLGEKDGARDTAIAYVRNAPRGARFLRCLRINALQTAEGFKDVAALADSGVRPDAILLPKAESPAYFSLLASVLEPQPSPWIAIIETARGLRAAEAIARHPAVGALAFGAADLAADLGAELAWEPMLAHRAHVARAAAGGRIPAWDVPYFGVTDPDDSGLIDETRRARALGYTGKLAIHPKHVAPIIQVFTPTLAEADQARRIVDAYERARGNACEVDGKMIDVPIYRSAQRVLARAR